MQAALFDAIDGHPAVRAARDLQPLLRSDRPAADAAAHMAPAVRAALGEAGMFRLAAPREVRGLEVSMPVMAAVLEALAVADPGTAWHLANSPMAGLLAASLDVATRERVFADPTWCYSYSAVPAGEARRVAGGYELNGRWPFVTGVRDAEWVVLTGRLWEGDEPADPADVRLFVVPARELVVEDTWSNAAAMRSSGSHAARAEALLVEEPFVYSFRQPRLVDRSLYRVSPAIVFNACASAVAVGVLRAALDATIDTASRKRSSVDGSAWSDRTTVRQGVVRAASVHGCIRSGLLAALDGMQLSYEATPTPPPEARAVAWATTFFAADEARRAIGTLAGPASSEAYLSGHGLEVAIRDIHAIVMALETTRAVEVTAGGALLGASSRNPIY